MSELEKYDKWLTTDEFAALTARQLLQPVEGADAGIFPPTYAGEEGQKGNYQIDTLEDEFTARLRYRQPGERTLETDLRQLGGRNVCAINSVGAEANKIEPLFLPGVADGKYAGLVPQVLIRVLNKKGELVRTVNLLEAGHRAGDAVVRFTKLGERLFDAFKAFVVDGNAGPLAVIAPTSLVFGVWDSRGTQAKVQRVFRSVVRAYNVREVKRSAQFGPALRYAETGVIEDKWEGKKGDENPLSREGFNDNPATGAPGGVMVEGDIRRDIAINLSAIRRLRVPDAKEPRKNDAAKTGALRRYVLGLSLVAATARNEDRFNLREGCQLKVKSGHQTTWHQVPYDGDDKPVDDLNSDDAVKLAGDYATAATKAFREEFKVPIIDVFGAEPKVEIESETATVEKWPRVTADFDAATAEKWLPLTVKEQKRRRVLEPMTQQFPPGAVPATKPAAPPEVQPGAVTEAEKPKRNSRKRGAGEGS